jgi:thiosulfate/3-mercaptopyruvate sulfurtransferase
MLPKSSVRTVVHAIAGSLLIIAGPSIGATQSAPRDSIIVSAKWLAAHASDPSLVILDVDHSEDMFRHGHIPGARYLPYDDIIVQRDGITSELPTPAVLQTVIARAGVSNGSHVVLYSSMPLMASRAFFTLDYAGLEHVSVLDGGAGAWQAAGHPMADGSGPVAPGRFVIHPRPELVADANWITAHAKSSNVRLIDTRTDGEYAGGAERHGMPSAGHLAGARQLQWQEFFQDPDAGIFKDASALASVYGARAAKSDTVVTYCWIGYRASMTYLVARSLGYTAKLYDGSYEDWAKRKLPVVAGTQP